jgi:hypothetical protein
MAQHSTAWRSTKGAFGIQRAIPGPKGCNSCHKNANSSCLLPACMPLVSCGCLLCCCVCAAAAAAAARRRGVLH